MKAAFVITLAFMAGVISPGIGGMTWQDLEKFFDAGHVVLVKALAFVLLLTAIVMVLLLEASKLREIAIRLGRRGRKRRRRQRNN